ncbi:putative CRAL-TRIO domain-containing protein C3H8.02 [Balamuthia mandrillaris]
MEDPKERRKRENENVEKIKTRLQEDGVEVDWTVHNDYTIKRFLRARDQDLDRAYAMFTASLKWRSEVGADTLLDTCPILNENFVALRQYWPGRVHYTDDKGAPVLIERVGCVDIRGLVTAIPEDDLVNFHVYTQEEMRSIRADCSRQRQKNIWENIIVEDLAGLSWKHIYTPAMDLLKRIIQIDEANYPESLKHYYVINAPKFINILYRAISPWLDPKTLSKVRIYGGNYQEALLKDIPKERLPKEYGGTCTSCSNEDRLPYGWSEQEYQLLIASTHCHTARVTPPLSLSPSSAKEREDKKKTTKNRKSSKGEVVVVDGQVFENGYEDEEEGEGPGTVTSASGCIHGGGRYTDQRKDGTTFNPLRVTVPRKSFYEVVVKVDESGVDIEWEFTTKGRDIAFGVFFQEYNEAKPKAKSDSKNNRTVIQEMKRVESHKTKVTGKITTEKSGFYFLVWDNAYSVLKKKQLTLLLRLHDEIRRQAKQQMQDWIQARLAALETGEEEEEEEKEDEKEKEDEERVMKRKEKEQEELPKRPTQQERVVASSPP